MAVGVFEVEGTNARGVRNGLGKELRLGRGELHLVGTQNPVGAVHVADDDGDMLKPLIVAPGIRRRGPSGYRGREELGELDALLAQPQPGDPHSATEHAGEALQFRTSDLTFRLNLECQDAGIKGDRPIQIRNREADPDYSARRGSPSGENRRPIAGKGLPRALTDRDRDEKDPQPKSPEPIRRTAHASRSLR